MITCTPISIKPLRLIPILAALFGAMGKADGMCRAWVAPIRNRSAVLFMNRLFARKFVCYCLFIWRFCAHFSIKNNSFYFFYHNNFITKLCVMRDNCFLLRYGTKIWRCVRVSAFSGNKMRKTVCRCISAVKNI